MDETNKPYTHALVFLAGQHDSTLYMFNPVTERSSGTIPVIVTVSAAGAQRLVVFETETKLVLF